MNRRGPGGVERHFVDSSKRSPRQGFLRRDDYREEISEGDPIRGM